MRRKFDLKIDKVLQFYICHIQNMKYEWFVQLVRVFGGHFGLQSPILRLKTTVFCTWDTVPQTTPPSHGTPSWWRSWSGRVPRGWIPRSCRGASRRGRPPWGTDSMGKHNYFRFQFHSLTRLNCMHIFEVFHYIESLKLYFKWLFKRFLKACWIASLRRRFTEEAAAKDVIVNVLLIDLFTLVDRRLCVIGYKKLCFK